uniref:Uncharacterized protein n=1 Tax=viral metagenome TaxID=1070528 RepID=A0A6C0H6J1_9ZZZZ
MEIYNTEKINQLTEYFNNDDNLYPFNENNFVDLLNYKGYFDFIYKINELILAYNNCLINYFYDDDNDIKSKLAKQLHFYGHSLNNLNNSYCNHSIPFKYDDNHQLIMDNYIANIDEIDDVIEYFKDEFIKIIFKKYNNDNELIIKLKTSLFIESDETINRMNYDLALYKSVKPFTKHISIKTVENYQPYFIVIRILVSKIKIYYGLLFNTLLDLKGSEL